MHTCDPVPLRSGAYSVDLFSHSLNKVSRLSIDMYANMA
jgi:hypothetical protein